MEGSGENFLRSLEKEIEGYWKKERIYAKAKEKNANGKKFYFCDGPPYATGEIHPGTAWNKCIKDAVCRYRRLRGFDLRAQPGYDTHGLPIEHKVELQLKIKTKKDIENFGIENFIEECKKYAVKYIGVMTGQFESMGVWMDFANPYITYKDEFIEKSWKTIKQAHEKELLKKDVYVLPICPRCETTMANYELEYEDRTDPSIYVKFRKADEENTYFLIWTTTPWTLQANRAVMAHPDYAYVKAKIDDETWIFAKERLEFLQKELGKDFIVLEEVQGSELEGKEYFHIIEDEKKCPVVLSDRFVTLEEGTGFVHCAPGHGPEDFQVGKEYGLEIYCPVDFRGQYTEGEWKGMNVKEADKLILEKLEQESKLVSQKKIFHRYPHCWRCKTPLIFIVTEQWFIAISKIRDKMVEEIKRTNWIPEFARKWFKDFVLSAPDWCISRQRYWGIPLPIWICECGELKVIGSKKELGKEVELHRPYIDKITFKCEKCGKEMKRVPDVLDVWFDSGNAIWASLTEEEEKQWYPCQFIVEGKDQIRGWFYSLLGSGIIYRNECPYKSVLMHGFFVDEKGEKMSKSVGNFVPIEQMLEKHGADTFRLWSLGSTIWEDLKFNWEELKEANGALMTLWNLHIFGKRFLPEKIPEFNYENLEEEDKYLLSLLEKLKKEVTDSFENYRIHEGVKKIRYFMVEEWSRFYMKIAKRRVQDGRNADSVFALYCKTLNDVLILLAPITPFLTEKIFLERHKEKAESKGSIFLEDWASFNEKWIDEKSENQMALIKEVANIAGSIRQKEKVKLRWPLEELVVETKEEVAKEGIDRFFYTLLTLANVKKLSVNKQINGKISSMDFSKGKVHLNVEITKEIFGEAMIREIARRIQQMRKDGGLMEKDKITLNITGDAELMEIVKKRKQELMEQVNASKLTIIKEKKGKEKEWVIEEKKIFAEIKKVGTRGRKKKEKTISI